MKNPCLVVIDVQEKLYPVVQDKENFLRNLEILIRGFKLLDLPLNTLPTIPPALIPVLSPLPPQIPLSTPILYVETPEDLSLVEEHFFIVIE